MKNIILTICFLLILVIPARAWINNSIAYSDSAKCINCGTDYGENNRCDGLNYIVQTIKARSGDTQWQGVELYLDRMGTVTGACSLVTVRFYKNNGCGGPNLGTLLFTKTMNPSDIPDGDAVRNSPNPMGVSGYAMWFIFDSTFHPTQESCYCIRMDGGYLDSDDRVNWEGGLNNYLQGSLYYTDNGSSYTSYGYDLNFRMIKDKYSLVAVRRFPFNLKGIISINSDIDSSSIPYVDTLHRWLNGSLTWGGVVGLNGKYADNLVWLARSPTADSLGKGSQPMPFYFWGLDTTTFYRADSIGSYISRGWADGLHTFGDCGYGAGANPYCMDSTHANKFMNYMINHGSVFDKLYKAGLWVGHGDQRINIGFTPGDTSGKGDSVSVYHHTHHTLASGRFKFFWNGADYDGTTDKGLIYHEYTTTDSMNVRFLPFTAYTLRDGTKSYMFYRNGESNQAYPEYLYLWFNQVWGHKLADSNYVSVIITHFATHGGIPVAERDSLKLFHDNAATWSLWLPSTKRLFNQQAASAFGQFTVDRPANSKRRINVTSLNDWSWGSHRPDKEELYYTSFIAYAPESLMVTRQTGTSTYDTLADSNMDAQQDVATNYGFTYQRLPMSYVGMPNRTAGRKVIIEGAPWVDSLIQSVTKVYTDSISFKLRDVITSLYAAPCDKARLLLDTLHAFTTAWVADSFINSCDDTLRVTGLAYSKKYYFKVYASDGVGRDTTVLDSVTTTAGPVTPTITVTSPNGGENWIVSSNHNITWTSTGTIADVKLEYSTNNGGAWTTITASTTNDGTEPWTIPNTPSVQCLVRVSDAVDGDPTDISNAVFTISATSLIKSRLIIIEKLMGGG